MPNPHNRVIRKAVIPAAGLGTRLLPFTKAMPKEMMPLGNKPLVQYAVEEAAASGIEEVILVTSRDKGIIQRHFRANPELEEFLENRGRHSDAEAVREISRIARISIAHQEHPEGLAHAILCARAQVGNEPFAVILPDAVIDAPVPCLRQLLDCYDQQPDCYVAAGEISPDLVQRFGILAVVPIPGLPFNGRLMRVLSLIEKPRPEVAPSCYGVFGRYLLSPDIFRFIARTQPDANGELQITDALQLYCREKPVFAVRFRGVHFDVGNKLDYLRASIHFALQDPELAEPLRNELKSLHTR